MNGTIKIQEANLHGKISPLANLSGSIRQKIDLRGSLTIPQVIYVGGTDNTYILVDDYGNEVAAVLSDEPVNLDATEEDIRLGKQAATSKGVTVGEKFIPAYHTKEGAELIMPNSKYVIAGLKHMDLYDFTSLQAIFCEFNSSISDSVSTHAVSINGNVYRAQSTSVLSVVTKSDTNKVIDFGIMNDTEKPQIIRFFTYKEI